jgi:hypothetical protein
VAEVGQEDELVRCERCGALKPASGCGCGGQGRGGPTVPAGWDPEPTRSARPRLRIVLQPGKEQAATTPDAEPAADPGPDHRQGPGAPA